MATTTRTFLFYEPLDLDESEKCFFVKAMKEFSKLLKRTPVEVDVRIDRLPNKVRAEVLGLLYEGKIMNRNRSLLKWFEDNFGYPPQLIIGCPPSHNLACAAKAENSNAHWGGAVGRGPLALTYQPQNQYVVWHEALHLLGAEDCYSLSNQGPTCAQANCIMQYAPGESTVGKWPWLCSENIKRVRERVAQFNKSV